MTAQNQCQVRHFVAILKPIFFLKGLSDNGKVKIMIRLVFSFPSIIHSEIYVKI